MSANKAAVRKILILAANPLDTEQRRLDEEVRDIQEGLKLSRGRDQFQLIAQWAVRTDDLRRSLLEHEPQIVHFSGHGVGENGLALEDRNGEAKLVSAEALARLFKLCPSVKCVVLNACYSVVQAEAIAEHVDYVVGMRQAIGDVAARKFAIGFYDALGYERSYTDAFEFGLSAIDLEGIPETSVPVLKVQTVVIPDPPPPTPPQRLFISYKRNVMPDESVAMALFEALELQHSVFIDQTMLVGTRWAERIETEIRQADALIVLLSEQSVQSEMVLQEVSLAHEVARERQGKPQLLPVRLAYREPFQYPLSVYLDPINWAMWEQATDTSRLIAELQQAIAGGSLPLDNLAAKTQVLQLTPTEPIPRPSPSAQPQAATAKPLELPEGTMGPESRFYVERPADAVALETIRRQGVTVTIKGPRQMGKSSLLIRAIAAAREVGKQVVFLDFQLFDRVALQNADDFYQQFCTCLTDELDLDDQVAEYWQRTFTHLPGTFDRHRHPLPPDRFQRHGIGRTLHIKSG
ncbi:MAG: TIR domain-containing protein, partial [Leptolyngbya sp. SIO4C5]|nr:TIR domain-containing protein [Leptolyngbya sp. SIO4C5]